MKKLKLALVLGLAVLLVTVFALPGPAAAADKKMWRWGTSNPGAYGYRVSAFLSDFLRRGMPDYDVTVYWWASWRAPIRPSRDCENCMRFKNRLRALNPT